MPSRLRPRKLPVQSRAEATVSAIYEATLQVLSGAELARLTTSKVAERAGVSVGTLYQYFPNKEALLYAVLMRHFEDMAIALERIETSGSGRSLREVADGIADAYVSVKASRPDVTSALYRVAGTIDQSRLPEDIYIRLETAVSSLLAGVSDAAFNDIRWTTFSLLSALAGLSRGCFGTLVAQPVIPEKFYAEARILSRAYLHASATERPC
ncbi:TetR/AcrR family transcriptional regulator [Rhizobium sp. Leaf384]|uniref:TetR/AcrR family transcriptional regulator n=1 Tax=Rhizobium sp. Leaf384 TaxID=1736358 RepID=UPI00244E8EAE|nr:TetR/AcrR family transcriptional regulator [Rhizobium sp. Leaf384]